MFLEKGVLKICSKFTGEHTCWSAISIKLLCNFTDSGFMELQEKEEEKDYKSKQEKMFRKNLKIKGTY